MRTILCLACLAFMSSTAAAEKPSVGETALLQPGPLFEIDVVDGGKAPARVVTEVFGSGNWTWTRQHANAVPSQLSGKLEHAEVVQIRADLQRATWTTHPLAGAQCRAASMTSVYVRVSGAIVYQQTLCSGYGLDDVSQASFDDVARIVTDAIHAETQLAS